MNTPKNETHVKTYIDDDHLSEIMEKRKAVKVYFELTNFCNLNCDYCPIDRSEREKKHMDNIHLRFWLLEFAKPNFTQILKHESAKRDIIQIIKRMLKFLQSFFGLLLSGYPLVSIKTLKTIPDG